MTEVSSCEISNRMTFSSAEASILCCWALLFLFFPDSPKANPKIDFILTLNLTTAGRRNRINLVWSRYKFLFKT